MRVDFYTEKDDICAAARLRRSIIGMCAVLLPMIALYVLAILKGARMGMLAALLAAFAWILFWGDMRLIPALRYGAFLKDMRMGLRRSTECILVRLEEKEQMQDGVRVRALHVRICDGEDSRIFYLNASHGEHCPAMGMQVRIFSYGRHILSCDIL